MIRIPAAVLLLLATILWGGNFVIGRAVADEIGPFSLAFFRWCTAFIVLFPFAYKYVRQDLSAIRQHWWPLFWMSLTGIATFNTLIYIALHYTTSINASLMNTSTPIIIYILSFIFLRERLTTYQVFGATLSLFGVLCILSKGTLDTFLQFSFNTGDLFVLVAVCSWAIYSLLVKRYSTILHSMSTFLITIAIGVVLLLPFFIAELIADAHPFAISALSLSAIFYTGIFASIVAFICWNTGVVKMGANQAGIFLNFIPLFASLFAVFFIGEKLEMFQLFGGLCVIIGIILSTKKQVVK